MATVDLSTIESLSRPPSPQHVRRAIRLLISPSPQQSRQQKQYTSKSRDALTLLVNYICRLSHPTVPPPDPQLLSEIQDALLVTAETHPIGGEAYGALIIIADSMKQNLSIWLRTPELIQRVIDVFMKYLDMYNSIPNAQRTSEDETIPTRVFDRLRRLVEADPNTTFTILNDSGYFQKLFTFIDLPTASDQVRIDFLKLLSLVVDRLPKMYFQLAVYWCELQISRIPRIPKILESEVVYLLVLLQRTNIPWVVEVYLNVLRNEEEPLLFRKNAFGALLGLLSEDRDPDRHAFMELTFSVVMDILDSTASELQNAIIRLLKDHESELGFILKFPELKTRLQTFLRLFLTEPFDESIIIDDIQNAFFLYMATLPEGSAVPTELKSFFETYVLRKPEFLQIDIQDTPKVKAWFASFFPPQTPMTKIFEYIRKHYVDPSLLTRSMATKYAKWKSGLQKKQMKEMKNLQRETRIRDRRREQTRQLESFRQHLKNVMDTILESSPEYPLIDPVTREIPIDPVIVEATPLSGGLPLHFIMEKSNIPRGRSEWSADEGRAPMRLDSTKKPTFRVRILEDHEIPLPWKNVLRVLSTRRQRIAQLASIREQALTREDKDDLEDEYAAIGQSLSDRLQTARPQVLRELRQGLQTVPDQGVFTTLPRREGQDDEWTEARRRVVGHWLPILNRLVDDLTRGVPDRQTPILLVDTMNALRKLFRQARQTVSYDLATAQNTDELNRRLDATIRKLRSRSVQQSYLNAPRIFVATEIVPPYPRKTPQIFQPDSPSGVIQRVIRIPVRRKDTVKAAIPVLAFDRSMDDLVLFVLASILKQRGYRPILVSNDKFRDWGGSPAQIRTISQIYPPSRASSQAGVKVRSSAGRGGASQQKLSSRPASSTPTPAQAYGGGGGVIAQSDDSKLESLRLGSSGESSARGGERLSRSKSKSKSKSKK